MAASQTIEMEFLGIVQPAKKKPDHGWRGDDHQAHLMDQAGHLMDELRKQRKQASERIDQLTTMAYGITNAATALAHSLDLVTGAIESVNRNDEKATAKLLDLTTNCIGSATLLETSKQLEALADKQRANATAWHKVEAAAPEKGQTVLAKTINGRTYLAKYGGRGFARSHVFYHEPGGCILIDDVAEWARIPA